MLCLKSSLSITRSGWKGYMVSIVCFFFKLKINPTFQTAHRVQHMLVGQHGVASMVLRALGNDCLIDNRAVCRIDEAEV